MISIDEQRYEEVEIFGFRLNQTSTVLLFVLAIRTIIGSVSTIYGYIIDLFGIFRTPQLDEIISFLIELVLTLILLAFLCYTIYLP